MCKKVWAITKINLKNIKAAYIITVIAAAGMLSNYIIDAIMASRGFDMSGNISISAFWALWILPILAAVLVPSRNFRRTVNLGGKRDNFFLGSAALYAVMAGVVALVVTVFSYAIDAPLANSARYSEILTAQGVFGWTEYGPIAAFFQHFAFLLLFSSFAHTLTAIQDKWYGWAADVLIIAIISVFTPIAPLRSALTGFFRLILFEAPLKHIPACLILATLIFSLNKLILARKAI